MKTIAALAVATAALLATPAVKAHDCGRPRIILPGLSGFGVSIAPRYVTTKEIYRSVQTQWAYDSWGNLVAYNLLVITYADYYCNGTTRTYTRAYRM